MKKLSIIIVSFVLAAGSLFAYGYKNSEVSATGEQILTGFAWSSTIGWICFADNIYCKSAVVTADASGNLSGYAWSSNIGWIQFGGLSGFPSGNNTTSSNANLNGTNLKGWARAVAGMPPSGTDNRGGWDGWINLDGRALNGTNYGVKLPGINYGGCESTPYSCAWGSTVVGWVDWHKVQFLDTGNICVSDEVGIIAEGQSVITYGPKDPVTGLCPATTYTCQSDQTITEADSQMTCPDIVYKDCSRDGQTYAHGTEELFYDELAVAGEPCDGEVLTCNDGTFVNSAGEVNNTHEHLNCLSAPAYKEVN